MEQQFDFLTGRATVTYNELEKTLTIKALVEHGEIRSHLEYIKDPAWNSVKIPENVKIILDGWFFDTEDESKWADIYCLKWLEERFTIVNKMNRVKYPKKYNPTE